MPTDHPLKNPATPSGELKNNMIPPPLPHEKSTPVPPPLPQKKSIPGPPPYADASSETINWKNRRAANRVELTTEVTLESETNFYTGFTCDISEGGLFVVTWGELRPIGTLISLRFTLPGCEELEVEGEVRWFRKETPLDPDMWPGMGIRFTRVPDNAKARINAFIIDRETRFFDDE